MPGPTPLEVAYRLEFNYTVINFAHKLHFYLDVTPSGDTTGFDTVARSGKTAVGLSAAIDRVWTRIRSYWRAADASFGSTRLSIYSSGAWLPQVDYATAVTPNGLDGPVMASQLTLVCRSVTFERMNFNLLEGGAIPPYHQSSYGALAASLQPFADMLGNAGGAATNADPYSWAQSRSAEYIHNWVSATDALNRKLRRRRNLA